MAETNIPEWVSGLRDRLVKADETLRDNAASAAAAAYTDHGTDAARLKAKAEGVRLALSYLDEYLRDEADCTCGYGGFHEPLNQRCERNKRGEEARRG